MYVLGLGDHVDCGSAILEDGRVIAAVNDERLVREKMVFGVPRESIRSVMGIAGIRPDQIDMVAVGTRNQHLVPTYVDFRDGWFGVKRDPFKQFLFDAASQVSRLRGHVPGLEAAYYLLRQPAYAKRRRALRTILPAEFGIHAPVQFVDHHLCHAAAAYYSSGFGPDATVLSVDGGGDAVSAKAFEVSAGRIREIGAVPSYDSLGAFYSYITQLCGFKAGRHEGKITGLAAHGRPRYIDILDSLLTYEEGAFVNRGNVFFHSALRELRRRLPEGFDNADLAASVQKHAERLVAEYARYWIGRTGNHDVALAGGVMANVRINQVVHELPEVHRCFVHPGMTDCGIGVGAAFAAYHSSETHAHPSTSGMEHVYLGPSYSEEEIERAFQESGVGFRRSEDVEVDIARLLADGAVVARFDGAMEYGPRALGNRSILYQPNDNDANRWLNDALRRTEFMPFAPAVLADRAEQCFADVQGAERTARFMTITFDCTEWMKEHCPGVVHIDGTARPQLVRREDNPSFYRIIEEYDRLTGVPVVVNTSFNIHEEPIVCSPQDAIRAFQIGHLDYLAMGSLIASNPAPRSITETEALAEPMSAISLRGDL